MRRDLFVDLLDGAQLLFEFHAPVLEPDLDLTFRQTEGVRDLDPPPPRQVVIEVELLLQFQRLVASVRLAPSSSWTSVGSFQMKMLEKKILNSMPKDDSNE